MLVRFLQRHPLISSSLPFMLTGLGVGIVLMSQWKASTRTEQTNKATLQNQAYLIDMTCVANEISPEPGKVRRPDYKQYCYNKAEELTGAQIHRFGTPEK